MNTNKRSDAIDLLGVGIGPFNLSIAALLSPVKSIISHFFDTTHTFAWHADMLFQGSELQVNYLKDLVTLVDPTNPYSFIAYLSKHKRLYRFINSRFNYVLRNEFNMYLNWVCETLPNLSFQEEVIDIDFKDDIFMMQTSKRVIAGKNLVLGNGLTPYIPPCARKFIGKNVYHNKNYLSHAGKWQGKRVAVIGGGQSGAEIVSQILSNSSNLPEQLIWVTKRNQILPIDDSVFINDWFTPGYSEHFFTQTPEVKNTLLQQQVLASDGISSHLLGSIYQRLYVLEFIEQHKRFFHLLPNNELVNMQLDHGAYRLTLEDKLHMKNVMIDADIIILCTGFRWELPSYLESLRNKITLNDGKFQVNEDFSVQWDGPAHNKIYIQNAARHAYGVADPNLALMAWRSAKIINSLSNKIIYDISNESSTIDWENSLIATQENLKHVSNA